MFSLRVPKISFTATCHLKNVPLTTNQSYEHNFLKRNSVLSANVIKFYFEILFYVSLTNSVLVVFPQKVYLFESLSACWRVHIPPNFVFSTYEHVLRMCSVLKSGSAPTVQDT